MEGIPGHWERANRKFQRAQVTKILHGRPKRFSGGWAFLGVCWGSVESIGPGPGPTLLLSNGYVPAIALKGLTVFGQGSLPGGRAVKFIRRSLGKMTKSNKFLLTG